MKFDWLTELILERFQFPYFPYMACIYRGEYYNFHIWLAKKCDVKRAVIVTISKMAAFGRIKVLFAAN